MGKGRFERVVIVVVAALAVLLWGLMVSRGLKEDSPVVEGPRYYHQKSVSLTSENTTVSESWATETREKPRGWRE